MSKYEILNAWSNGFTIAGVLLAAAGYFLWKRNYRLEQAHQYALNLLKKVKNLHLEIELLRRPKFHHPQTLVNDIEKEFIPQIESKILTKLVGIQVDLLVADVSLVKNKNLQSKFNETVGKNVIRPINIAVHLFYSQSRQSNFNVKESELFGIIFPSQIKEVKPVDIEKSMLGTGVEIINDKFNQDIKDNFVSIYSDLESNLASATYTKWIRKQLKKIFSCS